MSRRTDQQELPPVHRIGFGRTTPCGFDPYSPGPVREVCGATRWRDVTCLRCIEWGEKRYDGPQVTWPEFPKEEEE